MRALHVLGLGLWLGLGLACGKGEPAPSGKAAPVVAIPAAAPSLAASVTSTVRVDPALVQRGRVQVMPAALRDLVGARIFPGEAVSDELGHAEAGSLVAGRIASLEVPVGAAVKKGQVLAFVDAPEVARVVAEVIRARARVEVASRKEARQKELEAQQATSKNALDEANAEARIARADLAAASSLLAALGGTEPGDGKYAATSRVAVRSPIDGLVAKRMAVLGGAVVPERTLFEIVAPGRVAALVRLPETTRELPPNGTVAVLRPRAAGDARCAGTVTGDLGTVDADSRTRAFRVVPKAPCAWLAPGAFVDVELDRPTSAEAALAVPREALVDVKGVSGVFVQKGPGEFIFRALRLGPGTDAYAAVEAGLAQGEPVVVVGAVLLKSELLRAELAE
ncbi:MAG: efflux RND transporter periplasmic adaptor subunit [Polyangiaceae bacterium]|nr:efflux RND transporter periplasmic adaptor subunit [Polyangiaceae bacterium]